MSFSEGIVEMNGKRCHVFCKKEMEEKLRKDKGLKDY